MIRRACTAIRPAPVVRSRRERGATLVEAMAAGAVFAIGLLGLLAAQTTGAKQNWMASKESRATAIALDALSTVRRWPYPSADDPRLENDAGNDGDSAPSLVSGALTALPEPAAFEHDLNVDAGSIPPLPNAAIDFTEDDAPDFSRLLHVEPLMVGGVQLGITVSVVVAWTEDVGARQVVLPLVKYDPTMNFATIPGI